MKRKLPVGLVLAAACVSLFVPAPSRSIAADAPATAPGETIPHIPLDRIEFRGTGYPIVPKDVEALIDQRNDIWERLSQDAFRRAMPDVERWAAKGYPWIQVARQPSDLPQAEIPAFPGAEGGGMYARGGRGGRVFVVTSLADSGPGTFREACEAGGPRVVVFNVSGIIRLERPLSILAPYITIAGQTAPGDGVCIAGHTTKVRTHDVVIRHMRFRRGIHDISNRDDSLSGDPIGNVIIDHCSTSWGNDETLSMYRQMYTDPANPAKPQKLMAMNNTVQWTIVTETLDTFHHGFGATWGGRNTGFHHNLLACNTGRNASISASDFNFVNNVVFNWRHRTLDGGARTINVINNYFKPGPMTEGVLRHRIGKPEGGAWYVSGNVVDGNDGVTQDNWAGGIQGEDDVAKPRSTRLNTPATQPHMTTQSAREAYESVLAQVGATLPKRDAVDERVVRQVRTGEVDYKEGRGIITDIAQVGGYPAYEGTPAGSLKDGMPDSWLARYGLNASVPDLAAQDADGDGYTNIEEYLNGTDPTRKVDYKDLTHNVDTVSVPTAR